VATQIVPAPERADHTGTAPLPQPAAEALARLGRGYASEADRVSARLARRSAKAASSADFDGLLSLNDRLAHEAGSYVRVTPDVQRAVTRYGNLMARVADLLMRDRLTPAQFDGLADAQDELTRLHEQLEQAGQLHLVVA
jgi:hypothetical protein